MGQVEGRRESVGVVAVGGVGGESVEHSRLEASVGAGGEDGFEGESEFGSADASVFGVLGLANADHGDSVADVAVVFVWHGLLPGSRGG